MLGPHWYMRMRRWIQHPPSPRKLALVLAILAFCLALYGLEQAGLAPDWMEADRIGRRPPGMRF